jgi:hypothetical protein
MRGRFTLLSFVGAWVLAAAGADLAACGGRTALEVGSSPPDAATDAADDGLDAGSADTSEETPTFPVGVYSCTSDLGTANSGAGGTGALALTQTGAVVTASYAGDIFVSGALQFEVTTESSAEPAVPGQSLSVLCTEPNAPPEDDEPLTLASASLTIDGTAVFLSFKGTFNANGACEGVVLTGTLVCTN